MTSSKPYSVSQLNREARMLLESGLPPLWVEGEISNLATPRSGHWYFSLKDARAQIRCAMFRQWNRHHSKPPREGDQVLVRGRISLYEPRGDYQLICEAMEDAGEGALRRQYEQLKAKLEAEGLFDPDDKLPLPKLARRVGVVTSPSGAAIQDIINVLGRRDPGLQIIIYPVLVQGEQAAGQIAEAVALAGARDECDVLIVGRGGGSLEDLWAFNEEAVAQAIHACPLPVISAVGHETDFTIADFVASLRAPTPSAAAELVSRDRSVIDQQLTRAKQRLSRQVQQQLQQLAQQLRWSRQRLEAQHPSRQLQQHGQRLDQLEQQLGSIMLNRLQLNRHRLESRLQRLGNASPANRLARLQMRLQNAAAGSSRGIKHTLQQRKSMFNSTARALNAVSPLNTLDRGYSITTNTAQQVIRSGADVKAEDLVKIKLAEGGFTAKVQDVES